LGRGPKALLPYRGRPLVEHGVAVLRGGGCDGVVVVLGAGAELVRERADLAGAEVAVNGEWASGMGSSLRAGLGALPREAAAVVVALVDMPGAGPEAVRRLAGAFRGGADLAAAAYGGERGHPVLFAARWFGDVAEAAQGDAGARSFLRAHAARLRLVECGDVAAGFDIDTPGDLHRLG
jgi:nicotine blue oxidoreductase